MGKGEMQKIHKSDENIIRWWLADLIAPFFFFSLSLLGTSSFSLAHTTEITANSN